jgi:hypothetical protein
LSRIGRACPGAKGSGHLSTHLPQVEHSRALFIASAIKSVAMAARSRFTTEGKIMTYGTLTPCSQGRQ